MSDEQKQADVPAGNVVLSDETVNLLRNAAKRKGGDWTGYTPDGIANRLAAEFIMNHAFDKGEKVGAAYDAAKLPDTGTGGDPAKSPSYPSLVELARLEEQGETRSGPEFPGRR